MFVTDYRRLPLKEEKAVEFVSEKVVAVPTTREVAVERLVISEKTHQQQVDKYIPMYETKYREIDRIKFQESIKEMPKEIKLRLSVPVESVVTQIREVPRFEERLV